MILKRAADMIESFYTSSQQNMSYLPSPTPHSMTHNMRSMSQSFNGLPPSPYYPYTGGAAVPMGVQGRPVNQMRPEIMVTDALMEATDDVFGEQDMEVIYLKKKLHLKNTFFRYLIHQSIFL